MRIIQTIIAVAVIASLIVGIFFLNKFLDKKQDQSKEELKKLGQVQILTPRNADQLIESSEPDPTCATPTKPLAEQTSNDALWQMIERKKEEEQRGKQEYRVNLETETDLEILSSLFTANPKWVDITVNWRAANGSARTQDYFWENKYLCCLISNGPADRNSHFLYFPPLGGQGERAIPPDGNTKELQATYRIPLERIAVEPKPKLYWGTYIFQSRSITKKIRVNPLDGAGSPSPHFAPPTETGSGQ